MGAASPPTGTRRSFPPRRWWALALAAILLAVVLVITGALYFPFQRTGRTTESPGHLIGPDPSNASFLQDRAVADAAAVNLSRGPYELVGGLTITSDRGATLALDASGAFPCPLIPDPYPSLAAVEMPKVGGVTGGGLAPAWTFDYLGPGGAGVRIAVVDGKAIPLGSIMFSSPACPMAERPTVNVSTPDDSSTIGLEALHLGGADFLEENANAEVTYSLAPALEPGPNGQ
ncbi:MAG TPA: hypothetical protein VMH90_05295, partial [Thermoplasmata archaeon]|nr:hypothetical protein [Thermoplasmata archaeon]